MTASVIDDFEFVWMLRGQARFEAGDVKLLLPPGRLLLVPPGLRHRFIWDHRRASRHGYVHFDLDHVGGRAGARVQVRPMTKHDPVAGLCAYLLWLGRAQVDGWEDRASQTLRFLLTLFTFAPLPQDDARSTAAPGGGRPPSSPARVVGDAATPRASTSWPP